MDIDFVKGIPLNWQNEVSGRLEKAVMAYLNQTPTPEQLKIVIAYIQYHIHAPCWLESSPFGKIDEDMVIEINSLRTQSLNLTSLKDVNQYIHKALEIGLDPL